MRYEGFVFIIYLLARVYQMIEKEHYNTNCTIEIHKNGITNLKTDAVVNAANQYLQQGGGVCGAIFRAAGSAQLQAVCDRIGHCATGSAIITPAFNMKYNKYIIHAVGPRYSDGHSGEAEQLYSCYQKSLELAKENGCRSIGFPLISAGIFGYPLEDAWEIAIRACQDWLYENPDYELKIVFVNTDDDKVATGRAVLKKIEEAQSPAVPEKTNNSDRDDDFGIWLAEHHGDIQKRIRVYISEKGHFRDFKYYTHIADFADNKTAGYYVRYMRDKKQFADKDIIIREIAAMDTSFGEEIRYGRILGVIAVTGESLPIEEYNFT